MASRRDGVLADAERHLAGGRIAEAVGLVEPVVARDPANPHAAFVLARAALALAERSAKGSLRLKLRVARGDLCRRQHREAEAMIHYRAAHAALRAGGDCHAAAEALHGMTLIHLRRGELDAAFPAIVEAARLAPSHPAILCCLAEQQGERGDDDGALRSLQAAVSAGGAGPRTFLDIGIVLHRLRRIDEAEKAFRIAVDLDPGATIASRYLAALLYEQHRIEEAKESFARVLALDPADPIARHMLIALAGGPAPTRADDAFVRETFDAFAPSFEKRLVEELRYCGPDLVRKALTAAVGAPQARLEILDLGCGTGLCGPVLRPFAHRLAGVDLAARMLERARARDLYDELVVGEAGAFLNKCPDTFDLIVAADVFIYFGDLASLLTAAGSALRPGGHLVFTVERADGDADWLLRPHGRYAHGEAYLAETASKTGFDVMAIEAAIIRYEAGSPVEGITATFRRA